MIKKYLPNSILSCMEYAKRCDHYIMQRTAANYGMPNKTGPISMYGIKNGDTIWCNPAHLNMLFDYIEKTELKDLILISGDNDQLTNPNGTVTIPMTIHGCTDCGNQWNNIYSVVKFLPKQFKIWYTQNADVVNNTMIPIPVGLCPPWAMGVSNIEQLSKMMGEYERNKLLYINFNNQTNPIQRSQIFDIVTSNMQNLSTIGSYITIKDEMVSYYRALQEHKYVLCPPGNSKESHRMWESLYCGAIPIVAYNAANVHFSQMFPILVVERWSDITPDYLEKNLDRFINNEWRYDLLDCDNFFKEYSLRNNK
jgi:hypothetical protein